MNRQTEYNEDLLRQYINPVSIERAPEGFTSKTMTRIHIEARPVQVHYMLRMEKIVPLISAAVVAGLIIAAVLTPASETGTLGMSLLKKFQNIRLNLPELKFGELPDLNLPVWLVYIFIGIPILGLFDKVLSLLFKRHF
jgi:hypothetical protein